MLQTLLQWCYEVKLIFFVSVALTTNGTDSVKSINQFIDQNDVTAIRHFVSVCNVSVSYR